MEEQDPQMKDSLKGEFEDSENEGLTGTPDVFNLLPEGFANVPLPQFQALNIPCQVHSMLPTHPPPPPINFPPSMILALVTTITPLASTRSEDLILHFIWVFDRLGQNTAPLAPPVQTPTLAANQMHTWAP